ncbi:hypothetical protein QFC21_003070 [Naganishia friedmannii]|uniref:Uncharacterized protein n=1 Tax=Naganishia friedmannii TaxID=89922 RepID=A0ACC2VSH2_9TREE|nr:hypothetical protein QFC21_003070 [Naganishia friedmannii]
MESIQALDSPSDQDSLFGSSRRASTQGNEPTLSNVMPSALTDLMRPVVPPLAGDCDKEPTEEELIRNKDRFEVELEFIQCLASPNYLHELAIQGYLEDPAFLNFLEYLEYWREPDFAQHIIYPTCLKHLTLLKEPMFRLYLKDVATVDELHNQEIWHWATWREGDSTRVKREQHTRETLDRQKFEAEEAERKRNEQEEQAKPSKQ